MEKTKLKLIEISALSEEIHGLQDRQTGEKMQKGLLDEKLSLVQKYWLTSLGKKTKEVVEEVEPLRSEVISKYGETSSDGNVGISAIIEQKDEEGKVISRMPNPNWDLFNKEYSDLMSQEKDLEHQEFLLNDFSEVKSENRYAIFQTLLKP